MKETQCQTLARLLETCNSCDVDEGVAYFMASGVSA